MCSWIASGTAPYVICGQGVVDVLDDNGSRIQRIPTATGARTGLFVPELERLFVAVPARMGTTKLKSASSSRRIPITPSGSRKTDDAMKATHGSPMEWKERLLQPGVLAAFGAALLFGAGTPVAKLLLRTVDPWLLAGLLISALDWDSRSIVGWFARLRCDWRNPRSGGSPAR